MISVVVLHLQWNDGNKICARELPIGFNVNSYSTWSSGC